MNDTTTQVDIVGDLNIFNVAELRQRLLDALAAAGEVEVDLSQVVDIDSAGLQLMLSAKREAKLRYKTLRLVGHSPAVFELIELYDLSTALGDPLLISSRT